MAVSVSGPLLFLSSCERSLAEELGGGVAGVGGWGFADEKEGGRSVEEPEEKGNRREVVGKDRVSCDVLRVPCSVIYLFIEGLILSYSPINRTGSPQGFSQVQISYKLNTLQNMHITET